MPEKKLQEILDDLRRNLENSPDLDPDERAALAETSDEIRAALGADAWDGSLGARLSESLSRFEGAHPRLTETLRRLVDQLSDMGI
jgi:hypothetical protein